MARPAASKQGHPHRSARNIVFAAKVARTIGGGSRRRPRTWTRVRYVVLDSGVEQRSTSLCASPSRGRGISPSRWRFLMEGDLARFGE